MIDKMKTAMINGYTEGQAQMLDTWSEDQFLIFMEGVILPDGKQKQYVYADGSVKKQPPFRKQKIEWKKSQYGGFWWIFAEDDPALASDLKRNGGNVTMGGYDYSIKDKYIKKKISQC